jgi:hypothetical protein
MDGRSRQHIRLNDRTQRVAQNVWNDLRNQLAVLFQHSDHNGLAASGAASLTVSHSADARFVNLDDGAGTAKRSVPVERRHVLADFMAHAPRRFVSDSNIALDLLGGNAVPRRGEEEHHVEPVAKAGASAIERRPGGRIEVIRAPLTLIGTAALDAAVLQRALALGAIRSSVANLKQVIETAILSRKAVLKLAERWAFGSRHALYVFPLFTCVKGISLI